MGEPADALPDRAAVVALVGGALALFATYWDDAFHTDRGRDEFASPPHLALYGGIATALVIAAGWGLRSVRVGGLAQAWRPSNRVALALWGGVAVLASAPVDEFWHRAYGRDAVLWSPPHLVAVTGSTALLVGLLLGMRPGSVVARFGAGLGMAALLVPVMEYETDVPQFSPTLYLPVVVVGLTFARPVAMAAVGGRWALSTAAAAYTGFRVGVAVVMGAVGDTIAIVPPVLAAAALVDVVAHVVPARFDQAAVALAVPVAYVSLLAIMPGENPVAGANVLAATAIGLAVALAGNLIGFGIRRPVLMAVVLALSVVWRAAPAWAHDPGQGATVGTAMMTVDVDGRAFDVVADLPDELCERGAVSIVARRAGRVIRVPAQTTAGCVARGWLQTSADGRWFVYLEIGRIESWMPVRAGGQYTVSEEREVYKRPSTRATTTRLFAAVALLAAAGGLSVATFRTAARTAQQRVRGGRS